MGEIILSPFILTHTSTSPTSSSESPIQSYLHLRDIMASITVEISHQRIPSPFPRHPLLSFFNRRIENPEQILNKKKVYVKLVTTKINI
jgi:hypothetical protein